MSVNHILTDEAILLDVKAKTIESEGDVIIKAQNGSKFNLVTPNIGTSGQVLKSDGEGNCYFGNDTAGSSGIDYQGINPVTLGSHYKISNTLGTECENSKLVESSTDLDLGTLNITNGGEYNSTIIDNGDIRATGTSDLDLYPATNQTIRLHSFGEISAEDNKIINCLDPTLPTDVATKNYVDSNSGSGISFNGTLPTTVGEFLKFNSTDGSTVDKSSVVESATSLNLGGLDILNAGSYDNIDLVAFKADYDNKVNQDVRNTASPDFVLVSTDTIQEKTLNNGVKIDTFILKNATLNGSDGVGSDLNIYSTTNATQGTIRLHSEISAEDNKIINCSDPTIPSDVATKNYVDNQISGLPTQVYDLVIPLSTETEFINSTGIRYTIYAPRSFTITTVKASLTTAQTSGNNITVNVTTNGTNLITTPLSFTNGSSFSSQPTINVSNLVTNDKLVFNITQIGDGSAIGLKVTILGTV